jgi:aldehyde dehydrogenase (NAD+)
LADLASAEACADHLEACADQVISVLTQHESFEAANDEVERSIDALRNLHRELAHLRRGVVDSLAVFVPINLPLYSMVLFGAVPSLMTSRVDLRLPAATPETPDWFAEVADVAGLGGFFPRLHLNQLSRRAFIEDFAQPASAVLFTGRYENAEAVREACPDGLFIYTGAGINPVVVGPEADLTRYIDRIVTTRFFNGGQDCAGPDALLVHESRSAEFIDLVVRESARVKVGDFTDREVRVGRIQNPAPLKDVDARIRELRDSVVFGGGVDVANGFVEPTVIARNLADHDHLFEFFAPVSYVLTYESRDELCRFFADSDYTDHAMYASVFGELVPEILYQSSTVLTNRTVLDVEQGNTAYGGNGSKANYVALGDEIQRGPVLVSESLARIAR